MNDRKKKLMAFFMFFLDMGMNNRVLNHPSFIKPSAGVRYLFIH